MNRPLRLVLPCLGVFALASPLAGQPAPAAPAGSLLESADALYFAGHPREALDVLEEYLAGSPDDYQALWRATRANVVIGLDEINAERQNWYLDPAIHLGDRAVMARPDGIDGLYWRGAAEGRRALNAAPSYGADLAKRMFDDAQAILAMEPNHGGAHNLIGKLYFEVMSFSRVERWFGRTFTDAGALEDASWEEAEEHLEMAAQAAPNNLWYQFDLAKLYLKRKRPAQARMVLARVVGLPVVHPPEATFLAEAREFLQELGGA